MRILLLEKNKKTTKKNIDVDSFIIIANSEVNTSFLYVEILINYIPENMTCTQGHTNPKAQLLSKKHFYVIRLELNIRKK